MKNIFVFLLSVFIAFNIVAQYNMPVNGTVSYVSDNCWVYDDGGAASDYGVLVNGTMNLTTTDPSKYYIFIVTYSLEAYPATYLTVVDANNNSILYSNRTYNGIADTIYSCTNKIKITFSTDSDMPLSGFAIHLTTCTSCHPPITGLSADNISATDAYITWNPIQGVSQYIVAYGSCPFNLDSATFITTTMDSVVINNLDTCDTICATVFTACDTMASSCKCNDTIITQWIQNPCIDPHPLWISASFIFSDEDSVLVSWDAVDSVEEYKLEYTSAITGQTTIVSVFGTDTVLTDFLHCDTIVFTVYTPCSCDSCDDRAEPPTTTWIHCACPLPSNISMTRIDNDFLIQWTEPSDTLHWTINYDGQIFYSDTSFFLLTDVITDTCETVYIVEIYSNCHNTGNVCKKAYGHYTFNPCKTCFLPLPLINSSQIITGTTGIYIPWLNDNDTLSWIVSVYLDDSIIMTETVTGGEINLTGLSPETQYTIDISAFSATMSPCNSITLHLFTFGYCISYSNLQSPNVRTTVGSYDNPYTFTRLVDYGPDNILSRHTINTDTSKYDERTGYILRTIPEGSSYSVRLGNWRNDAEGESITYTYFVDTNNFDLLLLRYAIVLQDKADHDFTNQPSFTLEILDSANHLVDTVCGKTQFVAGTNTSNWNSADNYVRWKDWTSAGFDLSSYHNRKILIRLTTKDCKLRNHYGYAYFTLECSLRHSYSVACGETEANTFVAPEGFSYQWYRVDEPNNLLSTNRQFDVVGTGTQYYFCIVTSLENPNCSFIINATAGNRFPIAAFSYDYIIQDCKFIVTFHDTSYIATDIDGLYSTGEKCETTQWFFHNGDTSTLRNPTVIYTSTGDYLVRLVAGAGNNNLCTDTLEAYIHLESPLGYLNIVGDSSLCLGDTTTLTSTMSGECLWSTGDTTHTIVISPAATTMISVQVIDSTGCLNMAERLIEVHPHYYDIDVFDTICDNDYYAPEGVPLTASGIYHLTLTTQTGCDSIIFLHLTVNPTWDTIIDTAICQYEEYEFFGNYYDSAGDYKETFTNVYGCDSNYTLHLTVKPIYTDTIKANIFTGKYFNLFGFNESEEGIYNNTFTGVNGCDSIIVLDLSVVNIVFPNVITANGDGINDVFEIHNLLEDYVFPENELIIYNRYGKIVYHKKNISQYSDFWKPDSSTPTATYFYRFIGVRHDKKINLTGTVDVLR
ncbi:MAG: gliding motility-associated C-terminal domain-containing protein [Bacteroidales bacterium]|nr:gliding motility-associated C-terminal domain-containing protein [Bacteroidales bacterium]